MTIDELNKKVFAAIGLNPRVIVKLTLTLEAHEIPRAHIEMTPFMSTMGSIPRSQCLEFLGDEWACVPDFSNPEQTK